MFIFLEVDHMMFKTLITSKSSAAMKSIRIVPWKDMTSCSMTLCRGLMSKKGKRLHI